MHPGILTLLRKSCDFRGISFAAFFLDIALQRVPLQTFRTSAVASHSLVGDLLAKAFQKHEKEQIWDICGLERA